MIRLSTGSFQRVRVRFHPGVFSALGEFGAERGEEIRRTFAKRLRLVKPTPFQRSSLLLQFHTISNTFEASLK
jgi:hypothetical protein